MKTKRPTTSRDQELGTSAGGKPEVWLSLLGFVAPA